MYETVAYCCVVFPSRFSTLRTRNIVIRVSTPDAGVIRSYRWFTYPQRVVALMNLLWLSGARCCVHYIRPVVVAALLPVNVLHYLLLLRFVCLSFCDYSLL